MFKFNYLLPNQNDGIQKLWFEKICYKKSKLWDSKIIIRKNMLEKLITVWNRQR